MTPRSLGCAQNHPSALPWRRVSTKSRRCDAGLQGERSVRIAPRIECDVVEERLNVEGAPRTRHIFSERLGVYLDVCDPFRAIFALPSRTEGKPGVVGIRHGWPKDRFERREIGFRNDRDAE